MKRLFLIGVLVAAALGVLPGTAVADHPGPAVQPGAPASSTFNSGGEGATWELITSILTGNTQSDLDFFTQDGETWVSVGTIGTAVGAGGQSLIKITQDGEVAPDLVSQHPSAFCPSDPVSALGLQHDVEATPKGDVLLNTAFPGADTRDAQLIIDASDAPTRCHDQGTTGLDALGLAGAPLGGLEIIDVTDPAAPVEIALTSHIGEAHTVNVDPRRPHIVYAVTSDFISVTEGEDGTRTRDNEESGNGLDGWEVMDISSCLDFPEGTSVEDKRAACQPEVYRYRYETTDLALGHTITDSVYGCHELEVYPNDTLTCGAGGTSMLFDISGMFDDAGTPDDFTDDRIRGEPLPCRLRESTSSPAFTTGAMITDCVVGADEAELTVSGWLEAGAPSVEGVRHLGTAHHVGRDATGATAPYGSAEDIDFAHEAELTHSGEFMLATDERGGGVVPPGASCAPNIDNPLGNGGIHAYAVDRLSTERPATAEEAWEAYAQTPEGDKAIFRVEPNVIRGPQASICTAHVFQQIPGQNRIFMAWYSQGTRVLDYVEHPDGTFEWREAAYFIPENADEWVSQVYRVDENADGTFTYYGVAADFNLTGGGRNAVDFYKVTLPAPPEPPAPAIAVDRIAGDGPIGTAVAMSTDAYASADTVVLGRDDVYADSLAGGPLATSLDAPLLLTNRAQLTPAVRTEIERLGAQRAVLLGGEAALSPAVADELAEMGLDVERVSGANRFATAAAVAARLGGDPQRAFVAEGESDDPTRGFPDPIAAAPLAAYRGEPILLVNRDRLPDETAGALRAVGAPAAVIVGGPAAVSDAVEAAVAETGVTTSRLRGPTRYETALAVYDEMVAAGMDPSTLYLATGQDWRDALVAGPVAASQGVPLSIIDGTGGADTLEDLLARNRDLLRRVRLVGDERSITPEVEAEIRGLVAAPAAEGPAQAAGVAVPGLADAVAATGLVLLLVAARVRRRRVAG